MEDIEFRPIVIPKATMDALLEEENSLNLMGLYMFYYYTAIWQKTNQPRATNTYVANGLNVGTGKVKRLRQDLIRLGLIEEIKKRDPNTKRIIGHYIKVKYYSKSQGCQKARSGKTPPVAKPALNTYSYNSLNCNNKLLQGDSFRNRRTREKSLIDHGDTYGDEWGRKLKRKIIISSKYQTPKLSTWSNTIRDLINKDEVSKTTFEKVILWYIDHYEEKYCPRIYKVKDLREKWSRIVEARKRYMEEHKENTMDEEIEIEEEITENGNIRSRIKYNED